MIFVSQQMMNAGMVMAEMPDQLPVPELSEDPDGEISIDWYVNRTTFFSMSVGLTGRFPWASIRNGFATHGVIEFGDWLELQRFLR